MIVHNANMNVGASHARQVSDDVPKVVASSATVTVASVQNQATQQQPSPKQLNDAVNTINRTLQLSKQSLEFSVDESTRKPVVKMVDSSTGQLIRQFPSDEVLAIARSIDEFLELQHGRLLKQKA